MLQQIVPSLHMEYGVHFTGNKISTTFMIGCDTSDIQSMSNRLIFYFMYSHQSQLSQAKP